MVGTNVVVTPIVVVGATVVVAAGAVVVTGATVSVPLLHPETTNRNVSATAYFLTVSVCHPSPEGCGATLEPLGVDTYSRSGGCGCPSACFSLFVAFAPDLPELGPAFLA